MEPVVKSQYDASFGENRQANRQRTEYIQKPMMDVKLLHQNIINSPILPASRR